jgi:hypothetical protein
VTATSTTLVLTTAGAASGTAAITMTLTGLTLGHARAAVTAGFQMSSSVDTELIVGLNALAITGLTFASITLASQVSGATVAPVLVFTPATTVPIAGTITLTMPAGYFLGTVSSIASSVASLTATSATVTATSTTLVLTTAGAASGTAAITMTLTGLTLGAVQAAVTAGFKMSSSADAGLSVGVNAVAIAAPAPSSPKSSANVFSMSALVCFCVALFALF